MGDSPGEESTEDTDADRRPFRRWRASCMKDTKLMRKNTRFRWSWEHGGDLISLTFRVAAVVNGVIGVIGHCRAERWQVQDFARDRGSAPWPG